MCPWTEKSMLGLRSGQKLATLSNIFSIYFNRFAEMSLVDLPKAGVDDIRAVMRIIELQPLAIYNLLLFRKVSSKEREWKKKKKSYF